MNIKTIVTDLDRTLLRSDKTISPYTLSVLRRCREKGIRLAVATARPLRAIREYRELVAFDAMVVSNGARVITGDRITEHGIRLSSAERLLGVLKSYPSLCVTLETGECAYSNKPVPEYETVISDDLVSIAKAEGALKILVHIDSEETMATLKGEMSEDLYASLSFGYLMQIMDRAATKWNGVREILGLLRNTPEETAYFGDDYDDIEPIRRCGVGVAVANGIEEAKAAANVIAESNDNDGAAKWISQVLLGN